MKTERDKILKKKEEEDYISTFKKDTLAKLFINLQIVSYI